MRTLKYPPGTSPVDRVRLLRADRLARGLCLLCGEPRERPEVTKCDACRRKGNAAAIRRYAGSPDEKRVSVRSRNRTRKADVMALYGGRCMCCGETRYAFLTIDHINGDGAAHREATVGDRRQAGATFYNWLVKQPGPVPEVRILCWNCNLSNYYYGGCPHQGHVIPEWVGREGA